MGDVVGGGVADIDILRLDSTADLDMCSAFLAAALAYLLLAVFHPSDIHTADTYLIAAEDIITRSVISLIELLIGTHVRAIVLIIEVRVIIISQGLTYVGQHDVSGGSTGTSTDSRGSLPDIAILIGGDVEVAATLDSAVNVGIDA